MLIFGRFFAAVKKAVNEDDGYRDHLVGQKSGPYYCGTAFCAHSTKAAARKCWKDKCDAIDRIKEEANILRASNKTEEARMMETTEISRYYPETNPLNWPCNRSSLEMQREYIDKARRESGESTI